MAPGWVAGKPDINPGRSWLCWFARAVKAPCTAKQKSWTVNMGSESRHTFVVWTKIVVMLACHDASGQTHDQASKANFCEKSIKAVQPQRDERRAQASTSRAWDGCLSM